VCQILQKEGKKALFCLDNAPYHKVCEEGEIRTKYFEGRAPSQGKKQHFINYLAKLPQYNLETLNKMKR